MPRLLRAAFSSTIYYNDQSDKEKYWNLKRVFISNNFYLVRPFTLTDACRTFCIETPHECNRSSHDCFEPRFSENAETSDIIGSECICQSNGFIPSWRIFEIIFQIIFTNWRITDFEIGNFWCHSLRKITLSMFHVPNISLKRTFMKNRRSNWSTRNGYFWD